MRKVELEKTLKLLKAKVADTEIHIVNIGYICGHKLTIIKLEFKLVIKVEQKKII